MELGLKSTDLGELVNCFAQFRPNFPNNTILLFVPSRKLLEVKKKQKFVNFSSFVISSRSNQLSILSMYVANTVLQSRHHSIFYQKRPTRPSFVASGNDRTTDITEITVTDEDYERTITSTMGDTL